MRDLELFRKLAAGTATAAELVPAAAWPMSRRATLLRYVVRLAEHPEAEMRSAALATLAGARGVPGVRAIVKGLDDADPAPRTAALEALRATSHAAPARFSHALFHPDPAIRRAAPGPDVLDTLLAAILETGDLGRPLERFVELSAPKHGKGVLRRSAVSLITMIASTPRPELVAACVGLEPGSLGFPGFRREWIEPAIRGFTEIGAKMWSSYPQADKLLELPLVREPFDLGLAAAIAGMFPNKRLE